MNEPTVYTLSNMDYRCIMNATGMFSFLHIVWNDSLSFYAIGLLPRDPGSLPTETV